MLVLFSLIAKILTFYQCYCLIFTSYAFHTVIEMVFGYVLGVIMCQVIYASDLMSDSLYELLALVPQLLI